MKIIGIIGHAGSGKDEVATLLQELLPDTCRRSLAQPIKEIARRFGWDGKKDAKGRQLLMDLGMAGRAYDRDVWLTKCVTHFYFWNKPISIIPDVRFENEADHIFTTGGILIRVIRDSVEPMNHVSERGLDDYITAITLHNNGTLEELKAELYSELERLGIL